MVRFTLKQFSYFAEVAEQGGIARAARTLNISQPAIAQAIDKLEELSGLVLFERHHARGLSLTHQGREFLIQARQLLDNANAVDRIIQDIAHSERGTVRLGCFQSIAPFHVARLIRDYRKSYPDVTIDVTETLQGDIIEGLAQGDLDTAILYDLNLNPEQLDWDVIARSKPYILLAAEHPLAYRKSVSLHELADDPYILFDAANSREYFYSIFSGLQITPRVSLRSTSFESVRSAVGNGLGFSVLAMRRPDGKTYDGHDVVAVEISDNVDPIHIVLATRTGQKPGLLVRRFMDHCVQAFKEN